ncbi:hypothetical protein Tco_1040665 [Tanacetum coccineum]
MRKQDTGFPLTERDRLRLRGLLPPRVISFEQQYDRFMMVVGRLGGGVRVCAGHRCQTCATRPEYIPEHRIEMRVQTQVESDVAMTKRRYGNRATMQVVFIPKAKPDTVSEVPDHSLTLTSEFGPGVTSEARITRVVSLCLTKGPERLITPNSPNLRGRKTVQGEKIGKWVGESGTDDLKKPYKEVLESPFTRRIIKFSALSHQMLTNLRIYDGSTDPDDHISRFMGAANQGEWEMQYGVECFSRHWTARREGGSTACLTAVLTVGRVSVKSL